MMEVMSFLNHLHYPQYVVDDNRKEKKIKILTMTFEKSFGSVKIYLHVPVIEKNWPSIAKYKNFKL